MRTVHVLVHPGGVLGTSYAYFLYECYLLTVITAFADYKMYSSSKQRDLQIPNASLYYTLLSYIYTCTHEPALLVART